MTCLSKSALKIIMIAMDRYHLKLSMDSGFPFIMKKNSFYFLYFMLNEIKIWQNSIRLLTDRKMFIKVNHGKFHKVQKKSLHKQF